MSTLRAPQSLVIKGIITSVQTLTNVKKLPFLQLVVERGDDNTWIVNANPSIMNGAIEGSSVVIQCEDHVANETHFFDKVRQEFVGHNASGLSATNIIVKSGGDPSYTRTATIAEGATTPATTPATDAAPEQ